MPSANHPSAFSRTPEFLPGVFMRVDMSCVARCVQAPTWRPNKTQNPGFVFCRRLQRSHAMCAVERARMDGFKRPQQLSVVCHQPLRKNLRTGRSLPTRIGQTFAAKTHAGQAISKFLMEFVCVFYDRNNA